MEIKPIETVYKGYRFRSRLEARWAVFFDILHVRYVYEQDGFDLDGTYYLPDFYLNDYELYVEIKPFDKDVVGYIGDNNMWEQKCAKFRDITGKAILICYEEPAKDLSKILYAWDNGSGSAGPSNRKAFFSDIGDILVPPSSHEICITDYMKVNTHIRTATEYEWNEYINSMRIPGDECIVNYAMLKARQARFEHGEKP